MQECLIKNNLIWTLMILATISRAYSSAVTHRKDTNVGMQTWVGLTSNQDAMPPQSNILAPHYITHLITPVCWNSITYSIAEQPCNSRFSSSAFKEGKHFSLEWEKLQEEAALAMKRTAWKQKSWGAVEEHGRCQNGAGTWSNRCQSRTTAVK